MHTRQNMFPMLRKRKRKGLQEQWKYYTKDLSILYLSRLQRIWMDFSYRESTILTVYTVTTAQISMVSIQIIQSTSYFLILLSSTRGACCLSLLHCLPVSMLHPTLFLCRKLSPWSSSAYGFSPSQGLLTSHQSRQDANKKAIYFFLKPRGKKRPAAVKLKLCILLSLLTAKFHCKEASRVYHCFSVFSFHSTETGGTCILPSMVPTSKKHREYI